MKCNGGYLQLVLMSGEKVEDFHKTRKKSWDIWSSSKLIEEWRKYCEEEHVVGLWDTLVYKFTVNENSIESFREISW
jgi:hypothetical protein